MPEADPLAWLDSATARTKYNIVVTDHGLAVAREQCLREVGLALDTERPPSASFALGVAYQALANWQSTQAVEDDGFGGSTNTVRLYPMDKKIRGLLIIPEPDDDGRDLGRVHSLIG